MDRGPLAILAGCVLLAAAVAGAVPLVNDLDSGPDPAVPESARSDPEPVVERIPPKAAEPATAHEDRGPGADEDDIDEGHAGDAHPPGMERPRFPPAEGRTPTAATAESMERVSSLRITSDGGFVPANGIRSGTGTLEDPYVISGFRVDQDLFLADTDACFVIMENYIEGQLTLNWNGQCVHVHHNFIADLRVNENVRRTGFATGGLLELNKIQYVGQLRHYDGEFRDNVVGPRPADPLFDPVAETVPWLFSTDPRAANIDGFNQGLIHHNTFHGSVDLDFHGHHHGTGFFAPHSHYHGDDAGKKMPHDHTDRWTSVAFTDNKIISVADDDYGLRYEDRNHAGDDRTATSETESTLNEDHVHHTHIELARNEIVGQLWVDVFNADDARHAARNPGSLDISDNHILFAQKDPNGLLGLPFFGPGTDWDTALHVVTAKELEMVIRGNVLRLRPWEGDGGLLSTTPPPAAAISLEGIKDADVSLEGNDAQGFFYGVRAEAFTDVAWRLAGNTFDAKYPVWYGEDVAPPEE